MTTSLNRIDAQPEDDGLYNAEGIRVEREGDVYRIDRVASRYRRDPDYPNIFYINRVQRAGYTQTYTPIDTPPVTEADLQAEINTLNGLFTPANADKLLREMQNPSK